MFGVLRINLIASGALLNCLHVPKSTSYCNVRGLSAMAFASSCCHVFPDRVTVSHRIFVIDSRHVFV